MAEMDGASGVNAEQNTDEAAIGVTGTAADAAASESDGNAGSELPDWAIRQLGGSAEAVSLEDVAAQDSDTPDVESGGDDLPDWAKKKMKQMSAPPASSKPSTAQTGQYEPATTTAHPIVPPELKAKAPNLEMMLDLLLDVTVELGRAEMPLANVLGLKAGSVVQLDKLPGEPLDLFVNSQLVARGEIVVLNDTFAFRITDLIED